VSTLELDDLLDIDTYEGVRAPYRERVIAHKAERRVEVGELVSLTFEDRETVRYQIQEMARVEQLRDPAKLAHELEVYGELLPNPHELAATLFIQIPEMDRIKTELDRLIGIDECVRLEIGSGRDATQVPARFDERQLEADRISAVHYLRFTLDDKQRERFLAGAPARIRIDHRAYDHGAVLTERTCASLRHDLDDTTPVLLDAAVVAHMHPNDRVMEESELVRVLEPARKLRTHHLRIEPRDPAQSLQACDSALLAALFEAARTHAAHLASRGIPCRILAELHPDSTGPARVQVLSIDPHSPPRDSDPVRGSAEPDRG